MDRIKRYLAPLLLTLVACGHLIAVHTTDLNRWEGGGFGMYSELPPMTKHVVIDMRNSEKVLPKSAMPELEERTHKFEVVTSDRNLDAIAELLRQHGITPFRIQAWAEKFDLDQRTISLRQIGHRTDRDASP